MIINSGDISLRNLLCKCEKKRKLGRRSKASASTANVNTRNVWRRPRGGFLRSRAWAEDPNIDKACWQPYVQTLTHVTLMVVYRRWGEKGKQFSWGKQANGKYLRLCFWWGTVLWMLKSSRNEEVFNGTSSVWSVFTTVEKSPLSVFFIIWQFGGYQYSPLDVSLTSTVIEVRTMLFSNFENMSSNVRAVQNRQILLITWVYPYKKNIRRIYRVHSAH